MAESRTGSDESMGSRILVWLGLAWLVGFCLYFYTFTLPNNDDWNRIAIWLRVPDLLDLGLVFHAPWSNLAQRADIFVVAAFIVAGAWGAGSLLMRLVRPTIERRSAEHVFLAMALGLCACSLGTLLLGLAGTLSRPLFASLLAIVIAAEFVLRLRERRHDRRDAATRPPAGDGDRAGRFSQGSASSHAAVFWLSMAAIAPFLLAMWLGSMTPETDYDVREYHFEGPKEYFQNGRIAFLPHNVYTSFPFFTEMLVLLGMVLRNDWYWGALAGKCVLFTFAPLTGLGLYAAGRRWFNPTTGLLAAVIYLTTPWIYRISIIAYAEGGLTFYLFATLFAAGIAIERLGVGKPAGRCTFLAGLLAGCGMACKYTGLVQVVVPAAIGLCAAPFVVRRAAGSGNVVGRLTTPSPPPDRAPGSAPASATFDDDDEAGGPADGRAHRLRWVVTNLALFALGVGLTIAPWLVKNAVQTGNPVYPLAYSVFGGIDWNSSLDAKWRHAHSYHGNRTLLQFVVDVTAMSDWLSPLLYGLAPLALAAARGRKATAALWAVVVYLFVTWLALTHRIDRFWLPMIPVVALLAGRGATWRDDRVWRYGCGAVMALAVGFNLTYVTGSETSYLAGFNAFLMDKSRAQQVAEQSNMAYLNRALPPGSKVLFVGEAEVFEARFPLVYNTVFDRSIFQDWCALEAPGTADRALGLKPARDILEKLREEKITHVFVNWQWIRRYRGAENYGYTDFVTPARFEQLVAEGVLAPPRSLGLMSVDKLSNEQALRLQSLLPFMRQTSQGRPVMITGLFGKLSEGDRADLAEFGRWLLTDVEGNDVVINSQLFAVR